MLKVLIYYNIYINFTICIAIYYTYNTHMSHNLKEYEL